MRKKYRNEARKMPILDVLGETSIVGFSLKRCPCK
jgi:hypothetical protein